MSINKLIIDNLKTIAPTAFHEYTGSAETYITFFVINERAGFIADDDEISTAYSIQLDIYGKRNIEQVSKDVVAKLKELGFNRTYGMQLFNTDTKTYRQLFNFTFYMSEE